MELYFFEKVYWNYRRKSTQGWSIFNVMCDFAGGFFSFAQIVVDDLNGHSEIFYIVKIHQ